MSTTTVSPSATALIQQMRALSDVMEREGLEFFYAHLCEGKVSVIDRDFQKLFSGKELTGKRRGVFVDVEAEAFGLVFTTTLYRPTEMTEGNVAVIV